jgi:hypothetical protein
MSNKKKPKAHNNNKNHHDEKKEDREFKKEMRKQQKRIQYGVRRSKQSVDSVHKLQAIERYCIELDWSGCR